MNLHDYGFYGPIKWLSSVQVNSKILPLTLIIQIQRLPLNVLGLVKETLHNASWAFAVDGTDRNASSAVILPIHFTSIFFFCFSFPECYFVTPLAHCCACCGECKKGRNFANSSRRHSRRSEWSRSLVRLDVARVQVICQVGLFHFAREAGEEAGCCRRAVYTRRQLSENKQGCCRSTLSSKPERVRTRVHPCTSGPAVFEERRRPPHRLLLLFWWCAAGCLSLLSRVRRE